MACVMPTLKVMMPLWDVIAASGGSTAIVLFLLVSSPVNTVLEAFFVHCTSFKYFRSANYISHDIMCNVLSSNFLYDNYLPGD